MVKFAITGIVAIFSLILMAPTAGASDQPAGGDETVSDCVYQRDYPTMYDCQHSTLWNDCRHDPGCNPQCRQDDTVVHFYTCY